MATSFGFEFNPLVETNQVTSDQLRKSPNTHAILCWYSEEKMDTAQRSRWMGKDDKRLFTWDIFLTEIICRFGADLL